jgi:hypothetical protein
VQDAPPPTSRSADADLCTQDDNCRKRTNDLNASMRRTGADMPDRWLFLPMLT